MTIQLTIIGLNQIGLSIGLALSKQTHQLRRVGHDRDSSLHASAEKTGAVDETRLLLRDSARGADVIVLCQPAAQAIESLEVIAPDLKPECVLLDTSSSPAAFLNASARLLPANVFALRFVPALHPQYLELNPLDEESAREDLFKDSAIAISSLPSASSDALQLAADLAALLGAQPLFADPHEISGLLAASSALPQMAGAALLQAVTTQPGWMEGQKFAGYPFALATLPFQTQPEAQPLAASLLLEKENNLRVLDNYLAALTQLRAMLAEEHAADLETWLDDARAARADWMRARRTREYLPASEKIEIPTLGQSFGRLLGLGKRKPKEK